MRVYATRTTRGMTVLSIILALLTGPPCVLAATDSADFLRVIEVLDSRGLRNAAESELRAFSRAGVIPAQRALALRLQGSGEAADRLESYAWWRVLAADGQVDAVAPAKELATTMDASTRTLANDMAASHTSAYTHTSVMSQITSATDNAGGGLGGPYRIPIEKQVRPEHPGKGHDFSLVIVDFEISPEGRARDFYVQYSNSRAFSGASIIALRQWVFDSSIEQSGNRYAQAFSYRLEPEFAGKHRALHGFINNKQRLIASGDYSHIAPLVWLSSIDWGTKGLPSEREQNAALLDGLRNGDGRAARVLSQRIQSAPVFSGGVIPKDAVRLLAVAAGDHHSAALRGRNTGVAGNPEVGLAWISYAADQGHVGASVQRAWHAATQPELDTRLLNIASTQLDRALKHYFDVVSANETTAAVRAAEGHWSRAVKSQRDAIVIMRQLDMDTSMAEKRLAAYKSQQRWTAPVGSVPWSRPVATVD